MDREKLVALPHGATTVPKSLKASLEALHYWNKFGCNQVKKCQIWGKTCPYSLVNLNATAQHTGLIKPSDQTMVTACNLFILEVKNLS